MIFLPCTTPHVNHFFSSISQLPSDRHSRLQTPSYIILFRTKKNSLVVLAIVLDSYSTSSTYIHIIVYDQKFYNNYLYILIRIEFNYLSDLRRFPLSGSSANILGFSLSLDSTAFQYILLYYLCIFQFSVKLSVPEVHAIEGFYDLYLSRLMSSYNPLVSLIYSTSFFC